MSAKRGYRNKAIVILLLLLFIAFMAVYVSFYRQNDVENDALYESDVDQSLLVVCDYELPEQKRLFLSMAEKFQQETGIITEVKYIDSDFILMQGGSRSGILSEADVIICNYADLSYLMHSEELREIELSNYGIQERDYAVPNVFLSLHENGKLYGIPFMGDQYVLYIDSESMSSAGVKEINSWDDVYEVCAQRSRSLVYGIGIGGRRQTEGAYLLWTLLYENGCSNYTIDTEQGEEALKSILLLNKNGYLNRDSSIMTVMDMVEDFVQGHEAVIIAPYQYASYIQEKAGKEITIAKMPKGIRGENVLSYKGIGMTLDSDEKAESFVRFLFQSDVRKQLRDSIDNLPLLNQDFESCTPLEKALVEENGVILIDSAWGGTSEVYAEALKEMLLDRELQADVFVKELQEKIRVAYIQN